MRKIFYYLSLTFIIISCDSKEELNSKSETLNNPTQTYIINGDIQYVSEITDGSKPTKPILIYDIPNEINKKEINETTTSKSSEQSVNINFGYPTGNSTNSGCTVKRYVGDYISYHDQGVFGPNPYPYPYPETTSYLVRGYGQPHLNPYYGSLVLISSNTLQTRNTRYGELNDNTPRGAAISIEYPFKANVSYQISIKATFHDNRRLIDKLYSDGYPVVYVQLKNDGIIEVERKRNETEDPCDRNGLNFIDGRFNPNINYTRSYTPESTVPELQKNMIFTFSPTEQKKALLISLHPALGSSGYNTQIPTNSYTMILPLITITEKPFDPSLNVDIDIRNYGGGGRR